ncbi:MAG: SUMF1/EgtB/PvdO family nonheme iron enzyme [Roseomonas sp.]|nr:SUMF1/EgtB/PvdO family nonheme iron enzyme [Roseomonas sp.]MCA3429730.1 SUMF1/EgtB/PvdO family nonheme iron enzyme [Roseomonas sp.]MCA3433687.1 SUMF1/EgtB/PvdO family nonheme iron enzyme [Roseomonas sp.]
MRKLFIALIAMAASLPQAAQAQERWATEFWNPKPQPDDLILPMPCGAAMVFRPVPTPLGQGLLADRPAMLGQADATTNYSEFLRQSFIAGPFQGANTAAPPRYYIGKYEVTRDQYSAITSETCPTPATAGRLPQADIAWHEAVGFTLRYSAWLARNARDALPMRDDARAFVRLPTEDEWEFAARGGAAVSEADFSARVFPMPEGMQRHVWFQGTRSSGGRVRPIGMLEPNPLGIFDILGNVAEWVLEPYRLNRVGRPHGQAGGMVARGGDFLTPEDQIRSSLRIELPPLDRNGEALRLRSLGFRPVLALVATSSDQRPAQLRAAFEAEAQSRGSASEDPARLLEVLKNDTPDPALRQGIDRVGAALRTAQRERNDQEMQTIKSEIRNAAEIGRQFVLAQGFGELLSIFARFQAEVVQAQRTLAEDQGRIAAATQAEVQAALRRQQERTQQNTDTMARIEAALRAQAERQPARAQELAASYMHAVLSVGRNADRLRIADAANVVQQELQAQNRQNMPELARIAARHMVAVSNGNPPSREQALADLTAVMQPPASPPPSRR